MARKPLSPLGTTRTAPAVGDANRQVRFAWFTCQSWSANHWHAMTLMDAETGLDFIVHLGDYIYETVGPAAQVDPTEPAHVPLRIPNGLCRS